MHIIAFDRLLSVKWSDSMDFKCQMGRFNEFVSVKWGDYYYMPNGVNEFLSAK